MTEPVWWRGVFNTWQEGLGGHINIQHHANSLDSARHLAAEKLGLDGQTLLDRGQAIFPLRDRIDFRRELTPGDAAVIEGLLTGDRDGSAMLNGSALIQPSSTLTMRFETTFRPVDISSREPRDWPEAARGGPDPLRALRPVADPLMPSRAPSNAWLTWRGTVEVRDCDHSGLMTCRAIYDLITRALWAVHIRLGRHRDTMRKTGAAGAVTAIQVRYGRPARMGDLLEVRTSLLGAGSNSLRMGHLIANAVSGEAVAQVEYVNTFFSRTTGRKTPPEADYLEALLPTRLMT